MDLLSSFDVRALADHQAAPCVSIYLPTHVSGIAAHQQDPVRLKNHLREADERLKARGLRPDQLEALLQPGWELVADDFFWSQQSDGLALFLAPGLARWYRVPRVVSDLVVVNDRFHLKPLLPLLTGDGRFWVLALCQRRVRLYQATRHTIHEVVPQDMPASLAAALQYDEQKPDQTRAGGGPAAGGGPLAAHSGGGSDDSVRKEHVRQFYHVVDRAVTAHLRDDRAPLVLVGLDSLLPIYTEVNHYAGVLDKAVKHSPEGLSPQDLRDRAWAVVEPQFALGLEQARQRFQQAHGAQPGLASREVAEVLPAASQGRVETLFVTVDHQQWGTFDPAAAAVEVHDQPQPGDADLLDLAAVETFRNRGQVYAVARDEVPGGGLLGAVFRY